jgi:hypothetical protein
VLSWKSARGAIILFNVMKDGTVFFHAFRLDVASGTYVVTRSERLP